MQLLLITAYTSPHPVSLEPSRLWRASTTSSFDRGGGGGARAFGRTFPISSDLPQGSGENTIHPQECEGNITTGEPSRGCDVTRSDFVCRSRTRFWIGQRSSLSFQFFVPPPTSYMAPKLRLSTTLPAPSASRQTVESQGAQRNPRRVPSSPISSFLSRTLRLAPKPKQRPPITRRATMPSLPPSSNPPSVRRATTPKRSPSLRAALEAIFRTRKAREGTFKRQEEAGREMDDELERETPGWRLDEDGSPTGFGSPLTRVSPPEDLESRRTTTWPMGGLKTLGGEAAVEAKVWDGEEATLRRESAVSQNWRRDLEERFRVGEAQGGQMDAVLY